MKTIYATAVLLCLLAIHPNPSAGGENATVASPLEGTWTLVAADVQLPDGSLARDYGAAPAGRLMVDAGGHYALQIFKTERQRFTSDDKSLGTAEEFTQAGKGSSTHFGIVDLSPDGLVLIFRIERSSFPNWEGTEQKRRFEKKADLLTYRVPARPDGSIPITTWRRLP
jgi:hypothetical protein